MKIKITLITVTLITVMLTFSYRQILIGKVNKQAEVATKTTVATIMTGKYDNGMRNDMEESVSFSNKAVAQNPKGEVTKTDLKAALTNKAQNELDPVEDKAELEAFLAGFVDTGKPEAIMEHFAVLCHARAELIEKKMSEEMDDPEWTQNLVNSF